MHACLLALALILGEHRVTGLVCGGFYPAA